MYILILQSELPGFYDPCVGEEKQLLIQYLFRNETHECIVKDNAPVRIPLPCKNYKHNA